MNTSKLNNYINPFSKSFAQATKDFDDLTKGQKIIAIVLTAFTGLATIYLAGIGGYATFKALVDCFKAKHIPLEEDPTATKVDHLGRKILPDTPPPAETPKAIDVKHLSNQELLQRTAGMPLENNMLNRKSIEENKDEEQKKINEELRNRVGRMKEDEQRALLEQTKAEPGKFALVALGLVLDGNYVVSRNCRVLEACEWPSLELKEQLLPLLVSEQVLTTGIAWDNWKLGFVQTGESADPFNVPGFSCYRILLNTKQIFGHGNFHQNPQPISPYLAKAIGLAIKKATHAATFELKEEFEKNLANKDRLRIGVEVVISQSRETRFPASMIAPLLPHLKNIPELVSLDLSDVGVVNPWQVADDQKTSDGFCDEDTEALLAILRSPYLQQARINMDGMSDAKRKAFRDEWHSIWSAPNRGQKPSPQELFDLAED